ncbi:MAG: 50S ribosomal protein L25 [Patescibacteria group bacterium]|nr:50S ribosomal protein L25 [Patescibacteria group bacterium]
MSKIQLSVQKRILTQKLRKLTNQGIIPCVVYDQKGNSTNIQLDATDFQKVLPKVTPTTLIDLTIGKEKAVQVHIKEVQRDLRRNNVHHISFLAIDPDKESVFTVKIKFSGESEAVKNSIGILVTIKDTIELKGLPNDIPEYLTINIDKLVQVGETLTSTDIKLPKGTQFVHEQDKDIAIVTVRPFQKALEEEETKTESEDVEEGEEGEEPTEDRDTEATETELGESEDSEEKQDKDDTDKTSAK